MLLDITYNSALAYQAGDAVVQKKTESHQGQSQAVKSGAAVAQRHEPKTLDQLIVDESSRMFVRGVEESMPQMRSAMDALFDAALKRQGNAPAPR